VTELTVRVAAPAVVIVVEVEGPTRILHTASSDADLDALNHWIRSTRVREAAVGFAGLDRQGHGGRERGERWDAVLRCEPF